MPRKHALSNYLIWDGGYQYQFLRQPSSVLTVTTWVHEAHMELVHWLHAIQYTIHDAIVYSVYYKNILTSNIELLTIPSITTCVCVCVCVCHSNRPPTRWRSPWIWSGSVWTRGSTSRWGTIVSSAADCMWACRAQKYSLLHKRCYNIDPMFTL